MSLRVEPPGEAPWQILADDVDASLLHIFANAVNQGAPRGRVALLAVGGYGRRELAPFSDLDVLLVHSRREVSSDFVKSLWYPLWEIGRAHV